MTDTTYDLAKAEASGRCSESYEFGGRRIPHWIQPADLALIGGAGGIMSTATDLAQWSKLLLGAIDGNAIGIPTSILSAIEAPHALVSAAESRMTYGMGFFQQDIQGIPVSYYYLCPRFGTKPSLCRWCFILEKSQECRRSFLSCRIRRLLSSFCCPLTAKTP